MGKREEYRRLRFEQLETKTTLSSLLQTFVADGPVDHAEQLVAEFEVATNDTSSARSIQSSDVLRFVHANTYQTSNEWLPPSMEECQRADQMLALGVHELRDLL